MYLYGIAKGEKVYRISLVDGIKHLHKVEELSWGIIAEYIADQHKRIVSFAYLRATYLKLRAIREDENK